MTTMTAPRTTNGAAPSRMTLSAVTRGRVAAPLRVLCYGVEGVGKSTLGASAPAPIFLGAEDGSALLDVARFPQPRTWTDVLEAVRVLAHEEHDYRTLVIDSLDWIEPLVWAAVCAEMKIRSIEEPGFGKGYLAAVEHWRRMISALDALRRAKRMHIVLIGHALTKKFSNPEGADFDRYTLKLNDKAAALWREWVDELLFARFEQYVAKDKDTKRAKGISTGARIVHTVHTAAYDAKSRHGLANPVPLSWDEIEKGCLAGDEALLDAARASAADVLAMVPEPMRAQAETWLRQAWDDHGRLAQRVNATRTRLGTRADDGEGGAANDSNNSDSNND